MGDLNGDRARAVTAAAKTLRTALLSEEPEEHAKAFHREITDRAAELLKGYKTKPFTAAQTEVLCDLIASAVHMHSMASKKPDGWLLRLWRQFHSKDPMEQIAISLKVITFVASISAAASLAWYTAPRVLRSIADSWEGRPTAETSLNEASDPAIGTNVAPPDQSAGSTPAMP